MSQLIPLETHTLLSKPHTSLRMSHTADDATDWVCQVFAAERASTGSVKAAADRTARWFGITSRRALSYWWKQVSHVGAEEYVRLQARHLDRLRHARLQAEQELAALDALLDKLERSHGPTA